MADASMFTRFKRVSSVQRGDTQAADPKSVNRLSVYTPPLSNASSVREFLPSLTAKTWSPRTLTRLGIGLRRTTLLHQVCS